MARIGRITGIACIAAIGLVGLWAISAGDWFKFSVMLIVWLAVAVASGYGFRALARRATRRGDRATKEAKRRSATIGGIGATVAVGVAGVLTPVVIQIDAIIFLCSLVMAAATALFVYGEATGRWGAEPIRTGGG
jgi:hypothetical protein